MSGGLLQSGTVIAGYRVESVLGRGGMGVVYLATHMRLEKPVALKVLAANLREDEAFRKRFVRESKLAAKLDHPNILPVFDAGEADGEMYIALQYVDGGDLRMALQAGGKLSPERAIHVGRQVGLALSAAHSAGLIHRDVKPANILLGPRGHVFLADFGLARGTTSTVVTTAGSLLGTVDYCAPEQLRGAEVDGRADIYALGCVLYHSLAGHQPFVRDSEVAVITAHLMDDPPPLETVDPALPPELVAVVRRAMAKDREQRYQTADELVAALEAVAPAARPVVAGVAPPPPPPPPPPEERLPDMKPPDSNPTVPELVTAGATVLESGPGAPPLWPPPGKPPPPPPERSPRRRPVWAFAIGGAVLLIAVIAGVVLLTGGSGSKGPIIITTSSGPSMVPVNGSVVDSATEAPLSGVLVSTSSASSTTDARGRFFLGNQPLGTRIRVGSGCGFQTLHLNVHSRKPLYVKLVSSHVTGRINGDFFGATGLPAKVTYRQSGSGPTQTADATGGRVALSGACPGSRISVSAPGYTTKTVSLTGSSFRTTLHYRRITEAQSLGGTLFGHYSDAHANYADRAGVVTLNEGGTNRVLEGTVGEKLQDVAVDVDAVKVSGDDNNDFGIICRHSGDSYYLLEAASNGGADISKHTPAGWKTLAQIASTSATHQGSNVVNHLHATCTGAGSVTLALTINGSLVLHATDSSGLAPGAVGIAGAAYSSPPEAYRFSHFAATPAS